MILEMSPSTKVPRSRPRTPPPEPLAGRYHLTALLTTTPIATVHAARDLRLRRPVAVELVLPERAATELERGRLFRGAVLAAAIDHPQVMPLLDFGEVRGADGEVRVFRVTPPRRGGTLRGALAAGGFAWREAASLGAQLFAAVGAVHRGGGVHGAIRGEACLVARVDGRGALRLLEVGLASATGEAIDRRADVAAAAVVIGEALLAAASTSAAAVADEPVLRDIMKRIAEASAGRSTDAGALAEALRRAARREVIGCAASCAAARASLAAWTRFEYELAFAEARAAAEADGAWSPLRLLMSLLPES